ncbi:hypothetical protein AAFC00_000943 [Neodothiora populina]|uniref:Dynein light intermediate chain n=1 Tax=Neodothiora populina TaxID=2781224 RepID=A0ABR3PM91_9PEZI
MAPSAYRDAFAATDNDRPSTSGSESRKELWSSLLDNVASGKKTPEKTLLLLGGTSQTQKDFLDSLQQDSRNRVRPPDRSRARRVPVANSFALGYTYQDVYDSDHEDVVARLSAYTLPNPSPAYAPLLARLLTPSAIPHTAMVILLDWAKPWTFVRSLRSWVRLINNVTHSLPVDSQYALEENTTAWQLARDAALATSMADTHASMPLGPGEYDEPLGLPLVVVCQNALAVEALEKERGYRESHFDYILQFLRTVLLKHGAGLIYTMPSQPGQLQPLIHSILGIQAGGIAVTGKEKSERTLKHNVVDRERVLVPPAWDSWGKIRVLREGFDVEGISRAWGVEVQHIAVVRPQFSSSTAASAAKNDDQASASESTEEATSAAAPAETDSVLEPEAEAEAEQETDTTAALYEVTIQDPHPPSTSKPKVDVPCTPDQQFFLTQLERLEAYRAEDEAAAKKAASSRRAAPGQGMMDHSNAGEAGRAMAEHIGPVQFNVGGIQYDADEVLKRLKERNPTTSSTSTNAPATASTHPNTTTATSTTPTQPTTSTFPTIPPPVPSAVLPRGTTSSGTKTPDRGPKIRRNTMAASNTNSPFTPVSSPPPPLPSGGDHSGNNIPTGDLEAYFASLMKKGQRAGTSSLSNSPRPALGSANSQTNGGAKEA